LDSVTRHSYDPKLEAIASCPHLRGGVIVPGDANNVKQSFNVENAPPHDGEYVYSQKWDQKARHNPWVWVHKTNANAPHLTTWVNDFNGNSLKSFHLTYPYKGQAHKPVHVYFSYKGGTVSWWKVDGARCGGDQASAEQDAKTDKAKAEFTALATETLGS
jgi:hypothetical protein